MNLADCYRLLELNTGASIAEIKASYRRLARRYHPDVNPTDRQAKEKFIAITEAYEILLAIAPTVEIPQEKPPATPSKPAEWSPQPSPPKVKVTTRQEKPVTPEPKLSETDKQLKWQSYDQLQLLLKAQKFPRAIALIEGLAQRLPNDVEVRQWQAITYQRWGRYLVSQGDLDKARIYLKKALKTDPHNKSLWYEVKRDFDRMEYLY